MRKLVPLFLILNIPVLANAEVKEFDLSKITKLEVNNGSGDVKITAVETGKATVKIKKERFNDNCKLTVDMKKTTLLVKVEDPESEKCEVDFDIQAPKSAALNLNSGSGDIEVRGTASDLNFNVGSGDVDIKAEVKKLNGKSGSGDISIEGQMTGGNLISGSGEIELKYLNSPAKGTLDIKSGSGDTEINLPKDTKVHATYVGSSGDFKNELGDHPESKFKISVKSGTGNLHIQAK